MNPDTSPLLDIQFADIFSHSMGFLFTATFCYLRGIEMTAGGDELVSAFLNFFYKKEYFKIKYYQLGAFNYQKGFSDKI